MRRRRHPRAKHAPPGAALRRRVDAPDRAAAARQGGSGLRGQGGCQPTNDRPNSLKKRAPQAGRCPACRRASSRDQQRQGRQGCPTCRGRIHQGFSSSGNAGTLCREYPPCAVSKRQENRLLPYLQENPPAPYQRLENPIRHPATEDTLTGGIHQAELFFCIRNYSKTVPVAEGNVPLGGGQRCGRRNRTAASWGCPFGRGTAGPPLGEARGIGKSHIDLPRHKAVGRSLLTDRVSVPPQYDAGTSPFASPFPLSITPAVVGPNVMRGIAGSALGCLRSAGFRALTTPCPNFGKAGAGIKKHACKPRWSAVGTSMPGGMTVVDLA